MNGFKRVIAVAVGVTVTSAASLLAQTTSGFEPATNIGKESLPAGPLVYTAYAIVWLVLIGYVFMLWRRLDRVEKELREVAARIGSGKRA
jgi:CcmD family protein